MCIMESQRPPPLLRKGAVRKVRNLTYLFAFSHTASQLSVSRLPSTF